MAYSSFSLLLATYFPILFLGLALASSLSLKLVQHFHYHSLSSFPLLPIALNGLVLHTLTLDKTLALIELLNRLSQLWLLFPLPPHYFPFCSRSLLFDFFICNHILVQLLSLDFFISNQAPLSSHPIGIVFGFETQISKTQKLKLRNLITKQVKKNKDGSTIMG